jgi:hypothetical protein
MSTKEQKRTAALDRLIREQQWADEKREKDRIEGQKLERERRQRVLDWMPPWVPWNQFKTAMKVLSLVLFVPLLFFGFFSGEKTWLLTVLVVEGTIMIPVGLMLCILNAICPLY